MKEILAVVFLTVCSYHVTYVFQSESTLYSCLNVKEFLARRRRLAPVVVFLSTYRKDSIPLNMIFFYQSLNITVYVVLLMNGLNLVSQIENNMFQLMAMILILLM